MGIRAEHSPAQVSPATMSAAAVRAFGNIARLWKLDTEEQLLLLGSPPRSTFYKWKKQPETAHLGRDTLERISYILGIYKALQILLPDEKAADGWIRKPNAAAPFGGRSALERMLSGNVADLFVVRQYLDAMRGGWA
ncbi:MAG: MbcA/ParS/Xre antitoxin family protein [Bacillota bacterium]